MIGNISKDTEGEIFAERAVFILGSQKREQRFFRSRTERMISETRISDGTEPYEGNVRWLEL